MFFYIQSINQYNLIYSQNYAYDLLFLFKNECCSLTGFFFQMICNLACASKEAESV